MALVNTTAKELKEPTRASSRLLGCDDGLISLAPPAPKKRKKKGEAHPPSDDNATQIAPQPPNPEGRREPNPTQALLEGEDTPLDSLPAKKKRKSSKPKDKGKSKSAEEENTAAAVPVSFNQYFVRLYTGLLTKTSNVAINCAAESGCI